jgi:predicted RNA-binding Zn-ribbon protein involved in translation (DUF1610 family)
MKDQKLDFKIDYMIKLFILLTFLILNIPKTSLVFGQYYTTESKSCGSCGGAVSVNSRVGMTCPHCGVRWGYENEKKTTRYNSYTPTYESYDNYNSSGFVKSNANLRSQPSKNGAILTVIPAYTSLTILIRYGEWYYVEYSYYDSYYQYKKLNGYIHKSLIN